MARDLRPQIPELAMATRMNMLKLLQEVRGHAQFANRRLPGRSSSAFLLQVQPIRFRGANAPRKKTLTVLMRDMPDIPDPVTITHLQTPTALGQPASQ